MPGRKQFDVDEALDRAKRVFRQRGYAYPSLDALGSATGLGRGPLTAPSAGRYALFRQCPDRCASAYGARYEQALAVHPEDAVRAVVAFFDVFLARSPTQRSLRDPHRAVRRAVTDSEGGEQQPCARPARHPAPTGARGTGGLLGRASSAR
ncbi:hypothetical protein GCM10009753_51080 [Streptantibioticus ferralitis]